jgi:hypothetical protein
MWPVRPQIAAEAQVNRLAAIIFQHHHSFVFHMAGLFRAGAPQMLEER